MSTTAGQIPPAPSTGSTTIFRVVNCRLVMDHKVYFLIIIILVCKKRFMVS